jgi:hypothetical protein
MLGGKWCGLEDLSVSAKQLIDQHTTNVPWSNLRDVNAWINPNNPTNFITLHFSFGLGKQSFLVSFGKDGRLSQIIKGVAEEQVDSPPFQDFDRKLEGPPKRRPR